MFQYLRVRRPLVFVSVATTGDDPTNDRIVQIAMKRFVPGHEPVSTVIRLNPEREIPQTVAEAIGISNDNVRQCKTYYNLAWRVFKFLRQADIAGFGISDFDLPFIRAENHRTDWRLNPRSRRFIDVKALIHGPEPRLLKVAHRKHCGGNSDVPPGSMEYVSATIELLDTLLGRYKELPRPVEQLSVFLKKVDSVGIFHRETKGLVFSGGKYGGLQLDEVAG